MVMKNLRLSRMDRYTAMQVRDRALDIRRNSPGIVTMTKAIDMALGELNRDVISCATHGGKYDKLRQRWEWSS